MASPQTPDHFDAYRQILLWPLEICLSGSDEFTLKRAVREAIKQDLPGTPAWEVVPDPRLTGANSEVDWYETFNYFHPFVQRFLYPPSSQSGFRLLRKTGISHVSIILDTGEKDPQAVILELGRIHLYLFETQIAILVVEASLPGPVDRETALFLEDQLRRAFPPHCAIGGTKYMNSPAGGNYPLAVSWLDGNGQALGLQSQAQSASDFVAEALKSSTSPVASHWRFLMHPLTPAGDSAKGLSFVQIVDDRIPSMVFLEHADPHSISEGDRMRHCFLTGNGNRDRFPYSRGFYSPEKFAEQFLYTRFWDPPDPDYATLFMCCGYGFTLLAKTGDVANTLRRHFSNHYFQLGLLAHFHRASLLRFSRRFNDILAPSRRHEHTEMARELRREFSTFVSRAWFHEVSNQEQGRELFRLWSGHLGSEQLMKDILREVSAVDEVLELDRKKAQDDAQGVLSERVDRLTTLLYWVAALTLIVALLDTETVRHTISGDGNYHEFVKWWQLLWAVVLIGMLAIPYCLYLRPRGGRSRQ